MKNTKVSKTLCYILRHKPEEFGLEMDIAGWVEVRPLVEKLAIDTTILTDIVSQDTKGRYEFNKALTRIRATQGHSVPVDLDLATVYRMSEPVFHGTADRFLSSIMEKGLIKQSRQYVHLSTLSVTALAVGARYGKPVLLSIDVDKMLEDGYKIYISSNNVILTDNVPPKYITIVNNQGTLL